MRRSPHARVLGAPRRALRTPHLLRAARGREDARTLELTSYTPPFVQVAAAIPDEDFTRPVTIALTGGELPAAVLRQFLKAVEAEERRIGRRGEDTVEPADPREPTDPPRSTARTDP